MAYYKARNWFEENLLLIEDPANDPITWNLTSGLHELTSSIESDMAQIQSTLDEILHVLRSKSQ